ncbi:MAG: esterase-like activity of phytase family protein [Xanthobacteraceae bacterium]
MRWSGTAAFVIAAALLIGATPGTTQRSERADRPTKIVVAAAPLATFDHGDPTRRVFGMLEYRGGLVLTSAFREFGGISSIRVAADGAHFIAANDKGWWLRGRITYEGSRPTGIADAEMAPMLAADGRPITAAWRWYDSEAIAEDGGTLYVSLERVHRILRFDYGRDGLLARGQPIDVPKAMRKLRSNKGVEALVAVPRGRPLGGALIAISERGYESRDNHLAFLIGGPRPGQFAIRRKNDFDVSDAALLPGGDLLLLERRFGWTTGLFVRIRRISLKDLKPGAVLDGPAVFEADLGQQIDNLEGLSVHRTSGGELVLTLISDNNFSALQRTLLLQFTLAQP